MDETAAGAIDLATFKTALPFILNLGVPERIMTRLASIADFDGNGMINFAEFARLLTAESLKTIKQTLQVRRNSYGRSEAGVNILILFSALFSRVPKISEIIIIIRISNVFELEID